LVKVKKKGENLASQPSAGRKSFDISFRGGGSYSNRLNSGGRRATLFQAPSEPASSEKEGGNDIDLLLTLPRGGEKREEEFFAKANVGEKMKREPRERKGIEFSEPRDTSLMGEAFSCDKNGRGEKGRVYPR